MRGGNADLHHDRTLSHLGNDGANTMFSEAFSEGDVRRLRVLRFDEIDTEAREVTRRGTAFDFERRHSQLEQPPRQLVLHDGARADVRLVNDQVLWRRTRCHAIAVLDGLERLVTGHDRVDTERTRRWVGVKLTDRAPRRAAARPQPQSDPRCPSFSSGLASRSTSWICYRPDVVSLTPYLTFEDGGEVLLSAIQLRNGDYRVCGRIGGNRAACPRRPVPPICPLARPGSDRRRTRTPRIPDGRREASRFWRWRRAARASTESLRS